MFESSNLLSRAKIDPAPANIALYPPPENDKPIVILCSSELSLMNDSASKLLKLALLFKKLIKNLFVCSCLASM